MRTYADFLAAKAQIGGDHGFAPDCLPDRLFPFQRHLVEWGLRKGRAAIFADCGLGKTPMQLAWAEQVARRVAMAQYRDQWHRVKRMEREALAEVCTPHPPSPQPAGGQG